MELNDFDLEFNWWPYQLLGGYLFSVALLIVAYYWYDYSTKAPAHKTCPVSCSVFGTLLMMLFACSAIGLPTHWDIDESNAIQTCKDIQTLTSEAANYSNLTLVGYIN